MSIKVMSRIWEAGPEKQAERFILLALADYANDDGECWPSIAGISRKTCVSERGVQTIIRRLEGAGWLSIETGKGRKNCNIYTIKTPQELHPAGAAPPQMDAETPQMDVINPAGAAHEQSRTINEPPYEDKACAQDGEVPAKKPIKARLPEDWVLSEQDLEYAHSLKLVDSEIEEIGNDFHTYWSDRTDAGGRKSARGWHQAWRNRVRDQAPRFIKNRNVAGGPNPGGYGQGGSIASIVARRRAEGKV